MRYTIEQRGETWVLLAHDGTEVGEPFATYDAALSVLGGIVRDELAAEVTVAVGEDATTTDGLLPDVWVDNGAIAFSEPTGDGRDFTGCVWTWRDPAESLLPLMLQTTTDFGHFGAVLVGFMEQLDLEGGNPGSRGRFYDTDDGRTARDLLLDGRFFGVSVDPGAVSYEFVCTEMDDDGWCVDGVTHFSEYQIIGLTMTPFPAFARAAITLETGETDATDQPFPAVADDEPAPVIPATDDEETAAALIASAFPIAPPAAWFDEAEPELGDERLVDQHAVGGEGLACPLTILDTGQVYGHLASWGACHTAFPNECVTAPDSAVGYAHFLTGEVVTAEHERVPTGPLVTNCDHAAAYLTAPEARDHYAHNGLAWADVRIIDGAFGPWVMGALRPSVTPEQIRVVRASSLSGDWRRLGGQLELMAGLAVNGPGFPIARQALAASGLTVPSMPMPRLAVRGGVQVSLVAAGIVSRCAECERRRQQAAEFAANGHAPNVDLGEVLSVLKVIERRTRPLVPQAAAALRTRIRGDA